MTNEKLAKTVMDVIPLTMGFIRREIRNIPKSELTFPHYRLLSFLLRDATTNTALADWQGVSVAAMSRTVDTLSKHGLVERKESPEDRRQIRVEITKKGREAVLRARTAVEAGVADKLAKLPRSDQQTLKLGLAVLEELFS